MPKLKLKITKSVVDSAQANPQDDTWIWDTELEGFGIRVQPTGRKTYVVRYRTKDAARTQRKMTIARCCDLAPDRAREQARRIFAQVAEGQDPAAAMKPQAPVVPKASTATVRRMFEGYITSMKLKGRVSHVEVSRMLLTGKFNAAAALGADRPAMEVTPAEIVQYVSSFYEAGHRGAADKARSYLSSAFAWAIRSANDYTVQGRQDWGLLRNPAADVARDHGAIGTRDRNLSAAEMRRLWQATEVGGEGFAPDTAAAIQMMLCCGQRVMETLRMEGDEVDLKAAAWIMPAEKSKLRRPHVIPLPRQALPIIEQQLVRHGRGQLFPPRTGAVGDLIAMRSVNQAVRRWSTKPSLGMEPFQARDLRRTWKSRTHDAGIDRFTRDLIQQHAKNDTGSRHYDRADYLPIMREGMNKWSDWLDKHVI